MKKYQKFIIIIFSIIFIYLVISFVDSKKQDGEIEISKNLIKSYELEIGKRNKEIDSLLNSNLKKDSAILLLSNKYRESESNGRYHEAMAKIKEKKLMEIISQRNALVSKIDSVEKSEYIKSDEDLIKSIKEIGLK